jgi:SAM-dependent methyltransferase
MNLAFEDGQQHIINYISNFLKTNSSIEGRDIEILDVGISDGIVANRICSALGTKNISLYGVDLSENPINNLIYKESNVNSFKFVKQNIDPCTLPYESEKFDVVYSNQVIEHVIYKDHFIEECYRVLKKGGLFVLSTENIASIDNLISLMIGQDPLVQHTSTKITSLSILSPHFGAANTDRSQGGGRTLYEFHSGHKNVCSYYGLLRLMKINGFTHPSIVSFGHICSIFTKIFPWQGRVLVTWAYK